RPDDLLQLGREDVGLGEPLHLWVRRRDVRQIERPLTGCRRAGRHRDHCTGDSHEQQSSAKSHASVPSLSVAPDGTFACLTQARQAEYPVLRASSPTPGYVRVTLWKRIRVRKLWPEVDVSFRSMKTALRLRPVRYIVWGQALFAAMMAVCLVERP